MKKSVFFYTTLSFLIFAKTSAAIESTAYKIGFDDCKQKAFSTANQFNIQLLIIVDTSELFMGKILTSDQDILVNCSKPDQKMVITR